MNYNFTFTFVWDESKAEDAMERLWDEYGENFLGEQPYAYFYDIIDSVIYSAIFDTDITISDMDDGTPLSTIIQCVSGEQLKCMRKQVLTKYKEKLIEEMNAEEE